MNTNAVSLLEQYDLEIRETRRGRGAIICDTKQGLFLLKEYTGPAGRIAFQDKVLKQIREEGFEQTESILPDKEGNLLITGPDQTCYVCKSYVEGRECDLRDREEVLKLTQRMARLHNAMQLPGTQPGDPVLPTVAEEFGKRDRELRKVRKFLKNKGQKTEFELFLSQSYEPFLEQAHEITGRAQEFLGQHSEKQQDKVHVCHGDMQHHNLILTGRGVFVQGFEKCAVGNQMCDLYRFMRKYFEKNGWSAATAHQLIENYQKERALSDEDFMQLFLRFAYPEKFWKIVNFYFNKAKSWIPGYSASKLQAVLSQESDKQQFLREFERYL